MRADFHFESLCMKIPARYVLQFLPALGHLFIDTVVNVKVNVYSLYTAVKAASYEFYFTSLSFQNCSL